MNKYKYGLVDLSYLLSRNLYACFSRDENTTPGDVVKMTIQTLNKIPRDYGITVDKYVFLNDTWSKIYDGYYRTFILEGSYKTSRKWMTPELLQEIENNIESTPEEIKIAKLELYKNNVKQEAKRILKEELGRFGIPSIGVEGWEFDDLGYLAGCLLYNDPDPKPSVIITQDSDLQYSINPKLDYFRLPTKKSTPEVITYDQMYYVIPEELRKSGLTLYDYKAYLDSTGFEGHNDMKKTRKPRTDKVKTILQLMQGDLSGIKTEEVETYKKQLSTFDLNKFPRLGEAIEKITKGLSTIGHLGTIEEFRIFCNNYKMSISDSYYQEFTERFDTKLFCE